VYGRTLHGPCIVQLMQMQGRVWREEQWVCTRPSHIDIEQYELADPFDLRNDAFEVKCLYEHDFEDLLHVDGCGCRAKDEQCMHRFCKLLGLTPSFTHALGSSVLIGHESALFHIYAYCLVSPACLPSSTLCLTRALLSPVLWGTPLVLCRDV
jgi:hypothetical protein